MQWLEHKIPPPLVGLTLAVAAWWFSPDGWWGDASLLRRTLAGALALVGVGLDLTGVAAFVRARTTVNPLRPARASTLVIAGAYRFTRNPMYLGMALLLAGWAVLLGSWVSVMAPVVFVAFITRFQIVPEERAMAERFGLDYRAYCQRVRRWL
ncbi:MAG: isoprenylcysteine carboxylmethyltransferase family protein [Rhodoferax sp.]